MEMRGMKKNGLIQVIPIIISSPYLFLSPYPLLEKVKTCVASPLESDLKLRSHLEAFFIPPGFAGSFD